MRSKSGLERLRDTKIGFGKAVRFFSFFSFFCDTPPLYFGQQLGLITFDFDQQHKQLVVAGKALLC